MVAEKYTQTCDFGTERVSKGSEPVRGVPLYIGEIWMKYEVMEGCFNTCSSQKQAGSGEDANGASVTVKDNSSHSTETLDSTQ